MVGTILAGCTAYSLVESSSKHSIDSVYTVSSPIQWSKREEGNLDIWTREGPLLHQLIFFKGVKDGDFLFKLPGQSEITLPKFRKDMTFIEIQDLIVTSMKRINAQDVKVEQMNPETFGGKPGFRIDYSFKTRSGIGNSGFLVGTVFKEQLHAISYLGTDIHYFDLNRADSEIIVKTVRFIK